MTQSDFRQSALHRRLRRLRRRYRREDGVTAVEFALIAPVFLGFIFALFETCLVFFMSVVLEHGTQDAARLVRTGQVPHGITRPDFIDLVCDKATALPDCAARLEVDVKVISDFGSGSLSDPFDNTGNFITTGFGVDVGGPDEIIVVRTFYQWPLLTPGLSAALSNMPTNHRLLFASQAMKNEPF